jgi:outer membrane protein OmpA-like peptidoglycan-associated protein
VSLDWYLSRRVVGEVPRYNHIANGDFEGNWNGWDENVHRWSKPYEMPLVDLVGMSINGNFGLRLRAGGAADEVILPADDMFDTNSAVLTPTGEAYVDAIAFFSDTNYLDVTVYHDKKTLPAYNAAILTQQRAEAIKARIDTVNPNLNLTVGGRGGTPPFPGSNKTSAGRAENRRVEVTALKVIENGKKKPGQLVTTVSEVTAPVAQGRPLAYVLRVWFFLEKFLAAPGNDTGIELVLTNPRKPSKNKRAARLGQHKIMQRQKFPITAETPVGTWVRTELAVTVPANGLPYRIRTRLYAPVGSVIYDDVVLYADGSIYAMNWLQADIMRELVRHAQDESIGKSDLNIDFAVVGEANDTRREREYKWAEREVILELMNEFPTLADGGEWALETTPTSRSVVFYPYKTGPYGQTGGRGKQWNPYSLRLGDNLESVTINEDGSDVATVIVVRKDGEGIGREEGVARDTSGMNGLVLEKVYDATPLSSNSSLRPQADRGLARYRKPVRVPSVTTMPNKVDELLDNVGIGDRLMVLATNGGKEYEGNSRVTSMALDPATDQITYTLVPLDGSN